MRKFKPLDKRTHSLKARLRTLSQFPSYTENEAAMIAICGEAHHHITDIEALVREAKCPHGCRDGYLNHVTKMRTEKNRGDHTRFYYDCRLCGKEANEDGLNPANRIPAHSAPSARN